MGDPISSTRNLELVSKHAHPYGTTCPSDYNREAAQIPTPRVSDSMVYCFDFVFFFYNLLYNQIFFFFVEQMLN